MEPEEPVDPDAEPDPEDPDPEDPDPEEESEDEDVVALSVFSDFPEDPDESEEPADSAETLDERLSLR